MPTPVNDSSGDQVCPFPNPTTMSTIHPTTARTTPYKSSMLHREAIERMATDIPTDSLPTTYNHANMTETLSTTSTEPTEKKCPVPTPGSLAYCVDYDILQHEPAQCDRHALQSPSPVKDVSPIQKWHSTGLDVIVVLEAVRYVGSKVLEVLGVCHESASYIDQLCLINSVVTCIFS